MFRVLSFNFLFFFSGIFSAFHPAKDPVSSLHEESAVFHPEDQQKSLSILQTQEMHCSRNE